VRREAHSKVPAFVRRKGEIKYSLFCKKIFGEIYGKGSARDGLVLEKNERLPLCTPFLYGTALYLHRGGKRSVEKNFPFQSSIWYKAVRGILKAPSILTSYGK
jgi:hypothetical protein